MGTYQSNDTSKEPVRFALFSKKSHLVFWVVTLVGFLLDYVTKRLVMERLGGPEELNYYEIIPGWFRFATALNDGAIAGMASGKTSLLIAASIIAMVFLLWLFATSRANLVGSHIAMGMLMAGATGNLYDRIFNDGKVIDFIEVNLHFWVFDPWPTFNIADALLCVGVGLLMITFWRQKEPVGEKASENSKD